MTDLLTYAVFTAILLASVIPYVRRMKEKEARALEAAKRGKLASQGPRAQHPHIDVSKCIGCGTCAEVCPEGDVLGIVAGKAAIVNGHKCIGHGLCAEACPVGAIEIVMADPSITSDLPRLSREYETNVPNLFVVGELGGLALIKNAVNQGRECIDTIARRLSRTASHGATPGTVDVCIVGAGPGGLSASLRAIEKNLSYLTLEQDEFGGTVAKFPRQKLVMTSPVEIPLYGKFRKLELSKEELLAIWRKISERADLEIRTREKAEEIRREENGLFTVTTPKGRYRARAVILALGRRGTPRKLGIKGEDLPKVMYSLIEAEAYTGARILVVGGGDSAVEAAMGLAHQRGNKVALSYRRSEFSRLKDRNAQRFQECVHKGTIRLVLSSNPIEIRAQSVLLQLEDRIEEIPNDYVWIFAGGTPPNEFLEKAGVVIGRQDLTQAALAEAGLRDAAAVAPAPAGVHH
jgi:thioredoxin reductase/Pyruvate/2-oxoacid:ferredoxin oxidoreductase delta subunit